MAEMSSVVPKKRIVLRVGEPAGISIDHGCPAGTGSTRNARQLLLPELLLQAGAVAMRLAAVFSAAPVMSARLLLLCTTAADTAGREWAYYATA